MRIYVKLGTIIILGFILLCGHVLYRTYLVPEVLSDVAIQQMDRTQGAAPATTMRAHNELAGIASALSIALYFTVVLIIFCPEIIKTLESLQGALRCEKNSSSPSPSSSPDSPDA